MVQVMACQAIIWINVEIVSFGPLGTNLLEFEICTMKIALKMLIVFMSIKAYV